MLNSDKKVDAAVQVEDIKNNVEIPGEEIKMEPKRSASFTDTFPSRGWSVRSRRFSNMFAARKTVAQGMMDIALITANANQLRYVLDFAQESPTFYTVLVLIIISMVLQIIVGVLLIFKGRYDFRGEKPERARCIKSCIIFAIFLITVTNIFIATFNGTTASAVGKNI